MSTPEAASDMASVEQQPRQAQHPPQSPPQQQQQKTLSRPPVTQLEFHQAMRDFKTMFPEMDEDVIEVILRANNGAVDATIDQLLAMSTDNENERLRTELDATENAEVPPRYSPATPPPSYQQAVPYSHSPAHSPAPAGTFHSASSSPVTGHHQPGEQAVTVTPKPVHHKLESHSKQHRVSTDKVPLSVVKNWQPPLLGTLPSSFLRLDSGGKSRSSKHRSRVENVTVLSSAMLQQRMEENERQRRLGGTEDPELAQYLEDERIAIFLQNEEFMQELRRNKEFMSTLDKDSKEKARNRSSNDNASDASSQDEDDDLPPSSQMDAFPYTRPLPPTDDSDAAFREKLKNMGKMSRRKFAQLARLFSRTKKCNFRQILGDGTNPSRDNLLLHEDDYSELSEEDSEADPHKEDTWNSHDGEAVSGHVSDMERSKTPERGRPNELA